jgi:hypothetical protein
VKQEGLQAGPATNMKIKTLILICAAFFLLGVASRTAALKILHVEPVLDFAECELIAKSLATHDLFGDPYKVPTGATAHHAPVYPFLLSLIFRAFGYGSTAAVVMIAMNISLASLQYALLPVLGVLTGATRASLVAAFVGALVPWRIFKDIRWETSTTGFALLLAVLFTLRAWRRPDQSGMTGGGFDESDIDKRAPLRSGRTSLNRIGLFGFFWGVIFLVCPAALPAFLLLLMLFATKLGWKPALCGAAICGLTIIPWCVRNYVQLGGFAFIRDNFPIEFHVSNNDFASPLSQDNIKEVPGNFFHWMHPHSSESEALLIAKEGELAYNREKLHETLDWIKAHPRKFVVLTVQRIVDFWTLPSTLRIKGWAWVPVELMAIWGITILLKRDMAAGWVILAIWVGFPLVYYLVQVDSRYHYPLDWSTFFLAAVAAEDFVEKKLRLRQPESGVALDFVDVRFLLSGPSKKGTAPANCP